MDIGIYALLGIVIVVAIVVIVFTIKQYYKKKQELVAEEKRIQAKMAAEKAQWQKEQQEIEDSFRLKQEEFLEKVKAFEEERKQQADLNNKTDREVIIDLHTKTMYLFKTVLEMHSDLAGVEQALSESVGLLANSVESSESKIKKCIKESSSPRIDEIDLQMVIEDAVEMGLNSFETKLDSLDNKLNYDVDSKLDTVESKIDEIHYKLGI